MVYTQSVGGGFGVDFLSINVVHICQTVPPNIGEAVHSTDHILMLRYIIYDL